MTTSLRPYRFGPDFRCSASKAILQQRPDSFMSLIVGDTGWLLEAHRKPDGLEDRPTS